ncbi:MAG: amidohydrolase family protein [Verrucomicrobia bacterium]|nr:amidohydrolase family protein [Verrucomicrobiota bacterium]
MKFPTLRLLSALLLGVSRVAAQQGPPDLDIIDCHTHFYDPARPQGVPFPGKGTPLYRTTLPEHLRAQKMFRKVTGTVIVEASPWVEDNAWLLNLAEKDPFVLGIVGNLQPGSAAFAKDLDRFAANPLFRGIRISGTAAEKLLEADSTGDLQRLADRDLALDVNGSAAVVARLAERLPALRIVLNHSGHAPVTEAGPTTEWIDSIHAAAKHPNVFCKISHLVRTALHEKRPPGTTELDFYRPYLDEMWEAFGEDRVIYASNWPVSESISDYETLERVPLRHAFEKGESATRKFCSLNSQRAYRWVERPGRR